MEVSVENTSPLGRRLKVSLPDANLANLVNGRLKKLSKEVRLKGFRQGAVPHQVMQKRFGKSVHSEILSEVIQDSFSKALEQHQLNPTAMPKIDNIHEDEDGVKLEFTAEFDVFPEIQLTDFSEFEVEKPVVDLSEEDINKTIDKICKQMGHWHTVERSAEKGDKLTVDLTYRVEDNDSTEHKDFELQLDEKAVLPELQNGLVGKNIDEAFEIKTHYPESWPENTMAGKAVEFSGTVKSISEQHAAKVENLYERFELEGEDKASQLSLKIKDELAKQVNEIQKGLIKERILELLTEKNSIELPDSLIQQEKQAMLKEQQSSKRNLAHSQTDDEVKEQAERRVMLGLLINEVVQKFDIKVDGQRVKAEIEKIAAQYGQSEEIIKAYYKNDRLLQQIERQVLLDQAVDAMLENAKVVEKSMSFDELMSLAEQN